MTRLSYGMWTSGAGHATGGSARRDEILQAVAFALLLAVVTGLSLAGGGTVARLIYMGAAVAWSVITLRRSPWLFVTGNLWFWLFTSFARRIVEAHGGFRNGDLILTTPMLMAMFILPSLLTTPGLLRKRHIGYPMVMAGCVLYGLCVSFVKGDILGGIASATDWLTPVLYLFHFICSAEEGSDLEQHIRTFLPISLAAVIFYAFYEWYVMPAWDAQWIVGSNLFVLGKPLPMQARVFGSLNNPMSLSIWCATALILISQFRNLIGLILSPFALSIVALGQCRCVWGSLVVSLVLGVFSGRGSFGRVVVILCVCAVTLYAGLAIADPKVSDAIFSRFSTLNDLSHDGSAEVRLGFLDDAPAIMEAHPLGMGIGSQGRGAGAGSDDPTLSVNIDNGLLSTYYGLGWVVGTVYVLGLGSALLRALSAGRRLRSPIGSAMATAAFCSLGIYPFINVLGFPEVLTWCCIGYALAEDIAEASPAGVPYISQRTVAYGA